MLKRTAGCLERDGGNAASSKNVNDPSVDPGSIGIRHRDRPDARLHVDRMGQLEQLTVDDGADERRRQFGEKPAAAGFPPSPRAVRAEMRLSGRWIST